MKSLRLSILVLAGAALSGSALAQAPKPNIVFILADDLGWGDLGVFYQNSRNFAVNRNAPAFVTPTIDSIAADGIQLRRHYCAAPVCAPSRATLLTGAHQGHANVRDNQFDKALEDNHTVGTVLKQAGYATAMIGKYGLAGSGLPAPARPELRGFDYFFGYLEHGDAHFHYPKETGANVYDDTTDVVADLDKAYSTDLIAARAKKWLVDQHTAHADQPFFLYLPFTAPHARLDVPTQAYPEGKGVDGGLQWTGTPGSIINTANGTINSYIHPDYANATYDNDNNPATPEIAWPDYAKRHATMIRRLDDAISDLSQTLKDLGLDENTLIVFTSDNGPHNEAGTGGSYTYNPTFFDSFGPFDGIKRDSWEGGMREPTIVRWPGHIAAGGITTTASQSQDWLPTFAELAGVPTPARADGVSLVPTLTGVGTQRPSTIYVEYQYSGTTPSYAEFEPSRRGATRNEEQVIHVDGYKGIRYNITAATDDFKIYDTLNDPKETTDLAGTSAYFTTLQQRMKDRVLQVRRSGGGVTRPYDSALVPPITPPSIVNGLDFKAYEKATPWVPDWETETSIGSGSVASPDVSVRSRDNDVGLEFSGYLQVPSDGTYNFYLTTDTGAFVRLHDAQLIDADFGYTGGSEKSSGSIPLKAGYHPIRIHYRHADAASHSLALQWSGPGIAKQAIPNSALFHAGTPVPGPPTANADNATTPAGVAVTIPVLVNDTDDGTPAALSITGVTSPAHGTAVISGTGIVYTPATGFSGTDSFTYTITDGQDSATATVSVTVNKQIGNFLWLPLDETEGETAYDVEGIPIGTLQNFASTSRVEGPQLRGLTFDGTDDVISISPSFVPPLGSAPRTVTAWLKAASPQPELAAWLGYGVNTNGNRFSLRIDTGKLRLEVQSGYVVGTKVIADGNWHHVAVVISDANHDGTLDVIESKLYVDGQPDSISLSSARTINTLAGTGLLIGGSNHAATYNYAGGIDDLRIYPSALSAAEIARIASHSAAEDSWFFQQTGNASPGDADWTADTDGDGYNARLEFALGGNPTVANNSIAPFINEGSKFIFNRRREGIAAASYVPEFSEDLQTWSQVTETPLVQPHPDLPGFDRMSVPVPPSQSAKTFLRLRVNP